LRQENGSGNAQYVIKSFSCFSCVMKNFLLQGKNSCDKKRKFSLNQETIFLASKIVSVAVNGERVER